jgi:hypothetical protein
LMLIGERVCGHICRPIAPLHHAKP